MSEPASLSRTVASRSAWQQGGRALARSGPWLLLVAALVGKLSQCQQSEVRCSEVVADGNLAIIVEVCRAEYHRTGAPAAGAHYANGLRRQGELTHAEALARTLLGTSAQADACFVLAKVASAQERFDDAAAWVRLALALHRAERRWRELVRDLHAAAEVAVRREDFAGALELTSECRELAEREHERVIEGYCRVAAAHVLGKLGYLAGAERELAAATPLLQAPAERYWVQLELGNLHRERGELAQAIVAFERALALAGSRSFVSGVVSAHLNLAEAWIQRRDRAQARVHLEAAQYLDGEGAMAAERRALVAELALASGEPEQALAEVASVRHDAAALSRDEQMELQTLEAKAALASGQLELAERAARDAVIAVEAVQRQQPLARLRSWVMEHRRAPYDTLFLSLARRGQAAAALAVFDRWRAAISDPLATGVEEATEGLSELARKAAELRGLEELPVSTHPRARPEPLRASDTVWAFVVAAGELWRVVVSGGETSAVVLGRLADFEPLIAAFRSRPGDAAAATALGSLLLPPDAGSSTRPVRVVLDAPLALVPVAYLARAGEPLVVRRAVVHSMRPLDGRCAPRQAPRSVRVLADVTGDLPGARAEAAQLHARFGAEVAHGASATRAALFFAGREQLLHLAVHAEVDDTGGALFLHDARVSGLEIARRGAAPAKVVLASCGSAVARGGTQSLAMAYLVAGAEQVIASLRTVSDAGAARLVRELYVTTPTDLVERLAAAQRALLADPGELAAFAAFGHPVCED